MYRKRENLQKYRENNKLQTGCPFCNPEEDLIVEKGKFFFILKNKFKFDIWDYHEVVDHFMLIPYKHLHDFHEFPDEVKDEYFKLLEKYSKEGFDSFTRSAKSGTRSQPHIHTHLIKTSGPAIKKITYDDNDGELDYQF